MKLIRYLLIIFLFFFLPNTYVNGKAKTDIVDDISKNLTKGRINAI